MSKRSGQPEPASFYIHYIWLLSILEVDETSMNKNSIKNNVYIWTIITVWNMLLRILCKYRKFVDYKLHAKWTYFECNLIPPFFIFMKIVGEFVSCKYQMFFESR